MVKIIGKVVDARLSNNKLKSQGQREHFYNQCVIIQIYVHMYVSAYVLEFGVEEQTFNPTNSHLI